MASSNGDSKKGESSKPLFQRFPVDSSWELKLSNGEVVEGRVYTSDENSGLLVLQKDLAHTTLATEVRVVQVREIKSAKELPQDNSASSSQPLPKIQKKTLEEREKRALKLAEESLRHINQKVSIYFGK